jgi:nitroreductase
MTVWEAVVGRRSIRSYLPDPVPEEKLRRVLEAGRLAPSASNQQAWKFLVVTCAETRCRLLPLCRNKRGLLQPFIAEAPVVIAACAPQAGRKWNQVDCAIAVDHMTLVAYEEGLGTCWIGAFEPGPVKELLGIPEPVELVVLLTLGYPAQAGTFRGRKSLDEVTCYERYTPDPGEGEK